MIEEIIVSGRMNPEIDPHLHAWPWYVPTDLFIAALVAGILIFSAFLTLHGREDEFPAAVKRAPLLAPFLLGIALLLLFLDLSHKLYFWQLYTNIRWESPMSWGSWTYLFITPMSILWAAIHIQDVFPKLDLKFSWIKESIKWLKMYKKVFAGIIILLAITLGMYTGILLSAFNARPLWNSAILGPLFLTSGLTSATAVVLMLKPDEQEEKRFILLMLVFAGIQIFLLIHMIMGYLSGTQVHIEAAQLLLGGEYTTSFWVFAFGFGLILPVFLQALKLKGSKIPVTIPAMLIIVGGLLLRLILVEAGQASRWLY